MNYCKQCNELLTDDTAFCPKCGYKVEGTHVQPQATHNIVVAQKKKNVCSILAVIFGAIGIIPGLNFLFLPAAIILGIIGIASCKDRKKGSTIASIIVVVVSLTISIAWMAPTFSQSETPSENGGTTQTDNPKVNPTTSIFDGDCGITASAEIGNNIINFPELKITITNTTNKEIAAIKFYAVPQDVYGEEINSWMSENNLYTDDSISAGKTKTISYQLIDQSVKTVKLYVYSVYFSDGTEWGDKDATTSKIIEGAPTIDVTVKS